MEVNHEEKALSLILLFSLSHYFSDCYIYGSKKTVPEDHGLYNETIEMAVLKDGTSVRFNRDGGKYRIVDEAFTGTLENGTPASFGFEDILEFRQGPPVYDTLISSEKGIIKEVLLTDNQVIRFNSQGAIYTPANKILRGTDTEGKTHNYIRYAVKSVYYDQPDTVSREDVRKGLKKISQVLLNNNKLLTFREPGGRYEAISEFIRGVTDKGEMVMIKPQDVLYLNVREINTGLTLLASLGAVAAGGAVLTMIVFAVKGCCPFLYS